MKTVKELCVPRDSVFEDTARDDVLNLSDLVQGKVDGYKFFSENYKTQGMITLFDIAFQRFQGKSDTGVVKMTQAMGGGKTHSMIALAKLAEDKELRRQVIGDKYDDVDDIKVIAFSGRESDAEYGIWGELARQLGKFDVFKDLYSPLRAPGESAWINLLKGQKTLILLDELPPYLENAKSWQIGDSNLCTVTITALSNLFSALGKEELSNCCLVFSDLKATYESASNLLQSSFKELENEANRMARNIEPVALNSDEVYDILRARLFKTLPSSNSIDVHGIAMEYKNAVSKAEKAGLTHQSPDARFAGIKDSYPFHPSIKELYANFKENPNFQQTRGLIRLMRQIVRQFYESGDAERSSLINVYDIDLNNPTMLGFISEIKSSLGNAINHDVASHGKSIAEIIDAGYIEAGVESKNGPHYAQNISKLIFMASLNDVKMGINGLTKQDILGYLCEPGVDINQYNKTLEEIVQKNWYLKQDSRGKYYYDNNKNMVATTNTYIESYANDYAKKFLINELKKLFAPNPNICYKNLYVMPAIDEIKLERDAVSLVIFEPHSGIGMHPEVEKFYNNAFYKNRVMFLSGSKGLMDRLYETTKKKMAFEQVIKEMDAEHVPQSDQQYREALEQLTKAMLALRSTIVNTFVTLYFPVKGGVLTTEEIRLNFTENKIDGQEQIVSVLKESSKYEESTNDDIKLEAMRKKCEARIFTQKEMKWNDILERAATETVWNWYHATQMNDLKDNCLRKDLWRDISGYITKGPFAKEPTSVTVQQLHYDADANEFTLNVRGVYGDTVYYEVGAEPSTASNKTNGTLKTKDVELFFRCIDNSGEHPAGDVVKFVCRAVLQYDLRNTPSGQVCTLKTHPKYEIRYTTDGSHPRDNGGIYNAPFNVPKDTKFIRVVLLYKGELIDSKDIEANKKGPTCLVVNDVKPVCYRMRKPRKCNDTQQTYEEFDNLRKIDGITVFGANATVTNANNPTEYVEVTTSRDMNYNAENIRKMIDSIRDNGFARKDTNVSFEYQGLNFPTGKDFKNWVEATKQDMNEIESNGEVKQ